MTEKQTNALIKNPNTKKAVATLQKFAALETEYKALEKEAKKATDLIKDSMIEHGIDRIELDADKTGVSGFITLAERTSYKAADLDDVSDEFKKLTLDTDKVKASAVLTGALPEGIEQSTTQYILKKLKVEK